MEADRPSSKTWRPFHLVVVGLMMTLHFGLAWDVLRQETPTVDEVAHLPAGLSYLDTGDFRMYRHSPPLVRLLTAWAARNDSPRVFYSGSWAHDEPANHWRFAFETLAANSETAVDRQRYLAAFTRARLIIAGWSALTIPFLFAWGTWWFGRSAGVIAAALWTISPNILAHASLATTDLAATSLGLVSAYAFARWLDRASWLRATLVGVALGLAQLVKFSSLLLYPTFAVWAIAGWAWHRWQRKQRQDEVVGKKNQTAQLAAMVVVSLVVINAGYRFERTFAPLGEFPFVSRLLTKPRTGGEGPKAVSNNLTYRRIWSERVNRFAGGWLEGAPCPLPYHYVAGFDEQKFESEGKYPMYLRGQFANPLPDLRSLEAPKRSSSERQGWWYYYLYALAVKLPLGTLVLVLAALPLSWLRPARRSVAPIVWLAAAPILSMSFLTDINLGLRYVLPSLPFLFLLAGSIAADGRPGWCKSLIVVSLLWNAWSLSRIHPHELEYFNELAGGPRNGRFHLIDSNIDWGQDLRNLSNWLDKHRDWNDSVQIAYFGAVPPEFEGIEDYRLAPRDLRFVPVPLRWPWEAEADPWTWGPLPGKYAVSVNFERGMRFHAPCPMDEFIARQGKLGGALLPGSQMLEVPRCAYAYFQLLTPRVEPEIGYSILLYDVSLADANRVRKELGLPLLEGAAKR